MKKINRNLCRKFHRSAMATENELPATDPRLAAYTCLDATGKRVWGNPEAIRKLRVEVARQEEAINGSTTHLE
jgi:hypothetical protein